jgi:hypothetical protein
MGSTEAHMHARARNSVAVISIQIQTPYPETLLPAAPQVGLDLICEPVAEPRKTKIVCTLGPACWSEEGITSLIEAGMNVARLHMSHGTHKSHAETLERLNKVCGAA